MGFIPDPVVLLLSVILPLFNFGILNSGVIKPFHCTVMPCPNIAIVQKTKMTFGPFHVMPQLEFRTRFSQQNADPNPPHTTYQMQHYIVPHVSSCTMYSKYVLTKDGPKLSSPQCVSKLTKILHIHLINACHFSL